MNALVKKEEGVQNIDMFIANHQLLHVINEKLDIHNVCRGEHKFKITI